jgi:O-antigen ligase
VTGSSFVRKNAKSLGTILVVTVTSAIVLDQLFNLRELIVTSLGRDMTLTDRTFIWQDLLAMPINPIFGVGYDTFWLGERLEFFARKHLVAEAHNGYIEAYLEVGVIGCFLMLGVIFSGFARARAHLADAATASYGRLQLTVIAVFLTYNVTESAYKVTMLMAFTLILALLQRPGLEQPVARDSAAERRRRAPMRGMAARTSTPHGSTRRVGTR